MELKLKLLELSEKIKKTKSHVTTEAATKNIYIEPFINILGYDTTDPLTVVTEFTADIADAKGEKVDYAILRDGKPFLLIEAKHHANDLNNSKNQLIRYFNVVPDAKFAILTNGIEYRFFSDLDEKNIMDPRPFLSIDLEDLKDRKINKLAKFAKDSLNIDNILESANKFRNIKEITAVLNDEFNDPSEDFVTFFARRVSTSKRLTANIITEFKAYVKESLDNYLKDATADAFNKIQNEIKAKEHNESEKKENEVVEPSNESAIVTTEEELDAFRIIKAILSEVTDATNITYKDTVNYFGVLFEGNTRKWICRLFLDGRKKRFLYPKEDNSTGRVDINTIEDIYKHKKILTDVCRNYISGKTKTKLVG